MADGGVTSTGGDGFAHPRLSSVGLLQRRVLSAGAVRNRATFTVTMLSAGMPASHAALAFAVDSSGESGFQFVHSLAMFTVR